MGAAVSVEGMEAAVAAAVMVGVATVVAAVVAVTEVRWYLGRLSWLTVVLNELVNITT